MELIDVLTLQQRHDKDVEISAAIRAERLWARWITVPPDHIFRKLNDKAGQHSGLARQKGIPYVLAAYGEFTAAIALQEIEQVLLFQQGFSPPIPILPCPSRSITEISRTPW